MEDNINNAKKIKLLMILSHYEWIIKCNKYLKFFYNVFYLYSYFILL